MVIGILHEGDYDYGPLKKFVEKIFVDRLDNTIVELNFVKFCTNGPTHKKLAIACTRFMAPPMLGEPKADFVVFHSDIDGNPSARANRISLRDTYQRDHPGTHIALALPDPHLEQWFFGEADSLIRYFGFSHGIPVTGGNNPKEYLNNLIKEFGSLTESHEEIYLGIADGIDIRKLCAREPSFQYFVNNLIATYKAVLTESQY